MLLVIKFVALESGKLSDLTGERGEIEMGKNAQLSIIWRSDL